ncbi:hypothetical protein MCOR27_004410 [Pyricularia oryzae]|uniref:Ribonuclease H2 subunit B n=5 Tax=Pyricularia TaxID=48558 RepID=A0ABQ8NV59_PYRGI|nr:uncharacterized protein MGG_02483 [Pyricularia oryzae 70-15]ELQ35181.1 hypothetical protein OOU_Y34scaffold00725g39 [Pyricularia oryzae Y34]KAH8842562.1 hypothetical protein MCOR01_006467 [Pyricularia oryzae]KAI6302557.1 hypothetical protein MCOR33_002145 [Pyricularia grisea]EHA56667.1 hypothetical protein MGG_02483 [Pyricularia oryzae 70-15]KAH9435811.1 hypothetical protein MCOR02_004730 [Pyricularia oryzae]
MARTRTGKSTTAKEKSSASTAVSSSLSRYTIPTSSETPSRLFIIPKDATTDARIVALPNPRYAKPTRYLVCPETGIYEFTRIAAPKSSARSWLIMQGDASSTVLDGEHGKPRKACLQAEVSKGAELFVATKIDPVFLVLPALALQSKTTDADKRMFLTSEDHIDALPEEGTNLSEILRWKGIRELLESRMACVCDTVEAGDETMFRLSETKLLEMVLRKAKRMALPKSMHDKFVKKALEAPVLGQKSLAPKGAAAPAEAAQEDSDGASTPQTESNDSQSSVATAGSTVSQTSTVATSTAEDDADAAAPEQVVAAIEASDKVIKLQELRVAFNFICSSYLPPAITTVIKDLLSAKSGTFSQFVDFKPLDDYLSRLTKLRQEALLTRSASDFSRKRALDEEQEERNEKRRKMEEEDKRKKMNESRGVKQLKKVNVSGMKKLSEFFKKK